MFLRGGRLGKIDRDVLEFISSREADLWIAEADILVDRAHLVMLRERGLISPEDFTLIIAALDEIDPMSLGEGEDIHEAIEAALIGRVGPVGGRMHTGRSRNDEVVTCIRIALRDQMLLLTGELIDLVRALAEIAGCNEETLIPGFTHLQHAQPTTLAHHLLAHAGALCRDIERMEDAYRRVNQSPLGAAAFASTGFDIDRDRTCELLGFDCLVENSMDAVSARDFILEVLSNLSIMMVNLSRLAEEIILWSTSEFAYLEIDDLFASTSSIMPQKKNPDTAELVRGKTGSAIGSLTAALAICKALPMSYNRDLQEVTPNLWRGVGIGRSSVRIMTGCVSTLRFDRDRMRNAAGAGFSTATEIADSLVRTTGIPFRTAHQIVGRLAATNQRPSLDELDSAALEVAGIAPSSMGYTAEDLERALDLKANVEARARTGGPAPVETARMLKETLLYLEKAERRLEERRTRADSAIKMLREMR